MSQRKAGPEKSIGPTTGEPTAAIIQSTGNGSGRRLLGPNSILRLCLIAALVWYPTSNAGILKSLIVDLGSLTEDAFSDLPSLTSSVVTSKGTGTDISTDNAAFEIINPTDGGAPYKRYTGTVIVTKVLWAEEAQKVKEWVCLINHFYNDKMKHDFVIFTTDPWPPEDVAALQRVALPANLTVALEAPPLEDQLAAMTEEERKFLFERCHVNEGDNITWFHYCNEPGSAHTNNLGYSWQAEFRAYHIWNHEAIKKYKYMMWIDSDASVATDWDGMDPIKAMVENDLAILYAGWPYGKIQWNVPVGKKLLAAYNTSICGIGEKPPLHIYAQTCVEEKATIFQIAGNHHITNLDVFRKDVHQQFLKSFTGDYRFSRKADDQLAVTIVGLMEQYIVNNYTDVPTKSIVWHERSHGMPLMIAHHRMFDVVKAEFAPAKRINLYKKLLEGNSTGLEERCRAVFERKV